MTNDIEKDYKKPKKISVNGFLLVILGGLLGIFLMTALDIDASRNNQNSEEIIVFITPNVCEGDCISLLEDTQNWADIEKLEVREVADPFGFSIPSIFYLSKDRMTQILALENPTDATEFFCLLRNNTEACDQLAQSKAVEQTEMPKIELFVMSHCPFGVQMEKAVLPVLEVLEGEIDFELKFVDYAMHSTPEIKEQMREYCIQDLYPETMYDYLVCWTDTGNAPYCLDLMEYNLSELTVCFDALEAEYSLITDATNKSTYKYGKYPSFEVYSEDVEKYNVKGSPTFVLNGKVVEVERNPQAILNLVCESFLVKPDSCKMSISTLSPGAGFGDTKSDSEETGNCG